MPIWVPGWKRTSISQVLRVFASIFGQSDKQQGHRGEALLAVDELASADTIQRRTKPKVRRNSDVIHGDQGNIKEVIIYALIEMP